MDINALSYLGGIGLVSALVQVCKKFIKDDAVYPLLSMAFGIAINLVIAVAKNSDITTAVFAGIITGLTASGVYSIGGTGEKLK
jgi:hypothetical protein